MNRRRISTRRLVTRSCVSSDTSPKNRDAALSSSPTTSASRILQTVSYGLRMENSKKRSQHRHRPPVQVWQLIRSAARRLNERRQSKRSRLGLPFESTKHLMRHFAYGIDQQNGAGYLLVETISSRATITKPL